jgi:hypothetical protein
MFILGQAFGVAALVFEILTFQLKTKRSMLRAQIIANLFWSMSYIFLEAYSGTALSVMALTRVVVFYFLKDTSLKSHGTCPKKRAECTKTRHTPECTLDGVRHQL